MERNKHQALKNRNAFKKRNRIWLDNYKLKKGCEVCGWKDFVEALHVHHKVPILRKTRQERKSFLGRDYSIKV